MIKRSIVLLSFIVATMVLQGCVMTSTPFQEAQIQSDKALIYVYRPESIISRGIHFSVVVNETQTIGPLINNAYIPVFVKPGSAQLVLQKNSFPKATLDDVVFDNLKAGATYYIKANPAMFGAYKLIKMDDATGRAELSKALYFQDKR
ncbi:MAG: hypothetical protein J7K75_06440 [Desulfuromonas sp.]|nr:hypothetical protein [Desulfuromonas sp.]